VTLIGIATVAFKNVGRTGYKELIELFTAEHFMFTLKVLLDINCGIPEVIEHSS
jgi:hypothetical protein